MSYHKYQQKYYDIKYNFTNLTTIIKSLNNGRHDGVIIHLDSDVYYYDYLSYWLQIPHYFDGYYRFIVIFKPEKIGPNFKYKHIKIS